MHNTLRLFLFILVFLSPFSRASAKSGFEVGKGAFTLDGEPFTVKAAELHYPRIPRPYWKQRIEMCKALGMNTICLYTFWNAHEPAPDVFDFSGQNDIRAFIELCQEEGLKVILRPGPYVCAEWEMGGLPWWLLRKDDIRLREDDPLFLERVGHFQEALAAQLQDLTADKGGPIIMIQVENEYGSYGKNKPYVAAIRDMLRKNFGPDVVLFQCDWSSNFLDNGLDDLVWTLNFGTGADIQAQFQPLVEVRPDSPLMCSEFWSGWFDKWGAEHETRPAADMTAGIAEMLSREISFSLYMTHGGTNWGHWAGANSPGYAPDVTSYDYDAPISESGRPTAKYFALRDTLAGYLPAGEKLPPLPDLIPSGEVRPFAFKEYAPLGQLHYKPKREVFIRPMEYFGQGFGSIIYSTTLPQLPAGTVLTVDEPHDFARVFIDGDEIGRLDRRMAQTTLSVPADVAAGSRLDILVEATGRINFGRAIKDYKGITTGVYATLPGLPSLELTGWDVYLLPDNLEFYETTAFAPLDSAVQRSSDGRLPAGIYRGTFVVEKAADTFLRFDTWGKGLVYVNGHPLGRIWHIGPQQTLYTPACWLNEGDNEILVLDIIGPSEALSEGVAEPILDDLRLSLPDEQAEMPALDSFRRVFEGPTQACSGWQTLEFTSPGRGRYVAIEALEAHDGGNIASIAEIYISTPGGLTVPRENWRASASSSEVGRNRTPEKAFDLQESTSWTSAPDAAYPHTLVIDLGAEYDLNALRLLPRMEPGAPAAIRNLKVSIR
ncbi:MAG: beta-galactosidase [Muribaculaceae bacterium]|nr:beta-galactosidase [Muribaculaceae bacterium]